MGKQVFISGFFINGLHALELMNNTCGSDSALANGCVATIGSFDGVHIGHQLILQRLNEEAARRNLPSVVIIFEPQPHEYFSKEKAPARLMRLRDKVNALSLAGVDYVLCLRFDRHLRSFTAMHFVEHILHQALRVKHLEIGDDFRFGCDRAGDFSLLEACGVSLGFSVCAALTYEHENERVSSTRIRRLLQNNELGQAQTLLGKPFVLAGRVIYGRQLGRTIGVATANIALGRYRSPVTGVYAVEIELPDGTSKTGVANIGVKPTVEQGLKPILEVHIFNFAHDIYGQFLSVTLRHKLREEKKFDSFDDLKVQIQKDLRVAKSFFDAAAV